MKCDSKDFAALLYIQAVFQKKTQEVSYQTLEHGNSLKTHTKKQKSKLKYIFKSATCHLLHLIFLLILAQGVTKKP